MIACDPRHITSPGTCTFLSIMEDAEVAEAKLTEYLRSEVMKVEKECIRPLQVEAFRCSARCCEDSVNSQDVVQRCLTNCMQPVLDSEKTLQNEVQQLQNRLTRCAQQCEDEYRDSIPSGGGGQVGSKEMEKAQRCLVNCCETHSQLIPKLITKFRQSLKKC